MSLHTIEIDDDQILSLNDLADRLMKALDWKDCDVDADADGAAWDFHFQDKDGGEFWMTLDGMVYTNEDCLEPNCDALDFREILNVDLVWATDPDNNHPLAIIQQK